MTNQEAFDRALQGIRQQGGPSYDRAECLYRSPSGRKCGVGHLIADSDYSSDWEGQRIHMILHQHCNSPSAPSNASLDALLDVDVGLLTSLQRGHDMCAETLANDSDFMIGWEGRMLEIATFHGLTYTQPA